MVSSHSTNSKDNILLSRNLDLALLREMHLEEQAPILFLSIHIRRLLMDTLICQIQLSTILIMVLLSHRTHMVFHSTCKVPQCKALLKVYLSKDRDLNIQTMGLHNNSILINSRFSSFTLKNNAEPRCHQLSLNRKDHNRVLNLLHRSLNNSNFLSSSNSSNHSIKSKRSHSLPSKCLNL